MNNVPVGSKNKLILFQINVHIFLSISNNFDNNCFHRTTSVNILRNTKWYGNINILRNKIR